MRPTTRPKAKFAPGWCPIANATLGQSRYPQQDACKCRRVKVLLALMFALLGRWAAVLAKPEEVSCFA